MQNQAVGQSGNRAVRKTARLAWAVPAVLLLFTGAGQATQSSAPAAASSDTTTITIRSSATSLSFDPERFSVKAGTPVRVRYINESTFGHNMVIVKKDSDIRRNRPGCTRGDQTRLRA